MILLSVLPDFSSTSNWRKIDISSLSDSIVSRKDFFKSILRYEGDGFEENKSFAYNLVVKRDDAFYASKNCLFEFFFVVDHSSIFRTAKMTINIGADIHTIKSMKQEFEMSFGKGMFPVKFTDTNILEQRAMETIYKSAEIKLGSDTAYKFWTFTDWFIGDGLRTYRG
ncbi:hypothetical protein ACFSQ3_11055 [Sphingobacterium corticis]|uniref:Uncharacterized protein n=1 Tax=Sphingobacterium corticis TaxID=1812823 RepID=A0ABW5NK53_9SPHI